MNEALKEFQRLLDIMNRLRNECPWDKKQTIHSLRHLTIEETYELGDAILQENFQEMKKELGDLLLHIVFYAKIGEEKSEFSIRDVVNSINEKLIERHPHIFGNVKVKDDREVLENWENIKLKEGRKSVLEGVPKSLPALVKAYRIQDKARGVGFDWDNIEQVWDKVKEEESELMDALESGEERKIEEEFGDLLFALVNYSRFIDVNPESALERTNLKFIKRFQYLEQESKKLGKKLKEMTLTEMDKIWERSKKEKL